MAQTTTVARPYARAVFELARDAGDYAGWQAELELLALIVRDPALTGALSSPRLSGAQLAELVIGVAGRPLTPQARNLVHVLAGRKRLALLPEVLAGFLALRREAERAVDVELRSAVPVDPDVRQRIVAALRRRLGREVVLRDVTDAALLGGAVLRAGDTVIDASVRGQLERLATALAH